MDLKLRIVESIERKIELKNGLLQAYSLFNSIRRMKIIERIFSERG